MERGLLAAAGAAEDTTMVAIGRTITPRCCSGCEPVESSQKDTTVWLQKDKGDRTKWRLPNRLGDGNDLAASEGGELLTRFLGQRVS